MRKRHGRVDGLEVIEKKEASIPGAETGPPDLLNTEKGRVSWVSAITVGAQLALDIIRVIREATDLKRNLFPGTAALPEKTPDRQHG